MIEEGSKSSKSMVEKRQLFMEMSELLSELTTFPAQFTTHTYTEALSNPIHPSLPQGNRLAQSSIPGWKAKLIL